jgi:hypothetical protein
MLARPFTAVRRVCGLVPLLTPELAGYLWKQSFRVGHERAACAAWIIAQQEIDAGPCGLWPLQQRRQIRPRRATT